ARIHVRGGDFGSQIDSRRTGARQQRVDTGLGPSSTPDFFPATVNKRLTFQRRSAVLGKTVAWPKLSAGSADCNIFRAEHPNATGPAGPWARQGASDRSPKMCRADQPARTPTARH